MGGLQQAAGAATQPQPSANVPATAGNGPQTAQHILMIAPSGEAAYVPQDRVASYEAKGGQVGIRMTAPDGKEKAIVPFNKQDSYQKQGASWDAHPDNDAAKAFLTQRSVARSRSSTPGKALVTGPDGTPMFMDVPQGQEASTEAANQKGTVTGAAVGAGMLATAGLGATLAAPGVITEEAATGLLDEFGEPITREIIKQGPSLAGRGFQAAAMWAAKHPVIAKRLIQAVGIGFGVKAWNELSKVQKELGRR